MAKHDITRKDLPPTNQTHPERSATVTDYLEMQTHYPWLRLRGNWLREVRFAPACKVKIRVMTGCLVITKD